MLNPYYRQIPYAKGYKVSINRRLYNYCGGEIRTRVRSGARYASLQCDDHVRRYVNIDKLADDLFAEEETPLLTEDMILNRLDARPLLDWPRYAITSYGAVYCIKPPKRGFKARGCYLVTDRPIRGDMYVTLYKDKMTRKTLKVDDLIRSTWNY
tara:strand:- start:4761 stop:5222 length:462 start_codon:yes stop_codon:yes gene_type:complete